MTDHIQAAIDALLKIWPSGITCEHQRAHDAFTALEAAHIEQANMITALEAAADLSCRAPITEDTAMSRIQLAMSLKALGRNVYMSIPTPGNRH